MRYGLNRIGRYTHQANYNEMETKVLIISGLSCDVTVSDALKIINSRKRIFFYRIGRIGRMGSDF
jgi:hypothetical protein